MSDAGSCPGTRYAVALSLTSSLVPVLPLLRLPGFVPCGSSPDRGCSVLRGIPEGGCAPNSFLTPRAPLETPCRLGEGAEAVKSLPWNSQACSGKRS